MRKLHLISPTESLRGIKRHRAAGPQLHHASQPPRQDMHAACEPLETPGKLGVVLHARRVTLTTIEDLPPQ